MLLEISLNLLFLLQGWQIFPEPREAASTLPHGCPHSNFLLVKSLFDVEILFILQLKFASNHGEKPCLFTISHHVRIIFSSGEPSICSLVHGENLLWYIESSFLVGEANPCYPHCHHWRWSPSVSSGFITPNHYNYILHKPLLLSSWISFGYHLS